ncbi:vitelline membrane outer layer protein 1 homolog [Mercenaria mercenaria]|uniref:vitelline membrane outer layer protein 1 homolog n=1 Tax=Mercenaria mercenaria TaxID=6596 RepID=UPI00234E4418|nr:vitelline membrane outer layer protein 1 homolog [Mercenaria mercenaria]
MLLFSFDTTITYFEKKMDILQKGQKSVVYVSVEKNKPVVKLCKTESPEEDDVKAFLDWKCWLLKCLLTCIFVGVAAFLFVFLAHNMHDSESKIEIENAAQQSSTADAMESPQTDRLITKVLTVENGGSYGLLLQPQYCPIGTFAIGFNTKYQGNEGIDGDDTALNGISLLCADKNGIRKNKDRLVQSEADPLTGDIFCPKRKDAPLFLQRFVLKVHRKEQNANDAMATEIQFSCRDSQWFHHPHKLGGHIAGAKNGEYGQWSKKCPKGSAVCGIQTRIDGHLPKGNSTALNDVRLFCCDSKS